MAIKTSPQLSLGVAGLLRLLASTWRVRLVDQAGMLGTTVVPPVIWAFWHNRLLAVPVLYERFFRSRPSAVLISRSRDGGILAGVIERFGGMPVRGSSSRGGASAVRELQRCVESGMDAYITPDGPKGPQYSVGPGALWLARATGAPLLPVSVEAQRAWRLRSWDAFMVPQPFSRVTITLGPLHNVGPADTEESLEFEQNRLRETLLGLTTVR